MVTFSKKNYELMKIDLPDKLQESLERLSANILSLPLMYSILSLLGDIT
jgi:hypothetical protein